MPNALVARTVNEYAEPPTRLLITQLVWVVVHTTAPSLFNTEYPVAPLTAFHDTVTLDKPGIVAIPAGVLGRVPVVALIAAEEAESPSLLVALSVTLYVVPLESPVNEHDVDVEVQLAPPGLAVAV